MKGAPKNRRTETNGEKGTKNWAHRNKNEEESENRFDTKLGTKLDDKERAPNVHQMKNRFLCQNYVQQNQNWTGIRHQIMYEI